MIFDKSPKRSLDRVCKLSGLPGSGLKRFAQSLQVFIPTQVWGWQDLQAQMHQRESLDEQDAIWLWLIDLRQNPDQLEQTNWLLQPLLAGLEVADAVVFMFTEQVDLSQQSKWQAFMRKYCPSLTTFRSFSQQVPENLQQFIKDTNVTGRLKSNTELLELAAVWQEWQSIHFEFPRVSLEMLMMSLANTQQSLAVKIGRIQGSLQTLEYENRVALEVDGLHWQTYASDDPQSPVSLLRIEGIGLDRQWLQNLIDASLI